MNASDRRRLVAIATGTSTSARKVDGDRLPVVSDRDRLAVLAEDLAQHPALLAERGVGRARSG